MSDKEIITVCAACKPTLDDLLERLKRSEHWAQMQMHRAEDVERQLKDSLAREEAWRGYRRETEEVVAGLLGVLSGILGGPGVVVQRFPVSMTQRIEDLRVHVEGWRRQVTQLPPEPEPKEKP